MTGEEKHIIKAKTLKFMFCGITGKELQLIRVEFPNKVSIPFIDIIYIKNSVTILKDF